MLGTNLVGKNYLNGYLRLSQFVNRRDFNGDIHSFCYYYTNFPDLIYFYPPLSQTKRILCTGSGINRAWPVICAPEGEEFYDDPMPADYVPATFIVGKLFVPPFQFYFPPPCWPV